MAEGFIVRRNSPQQMYDGTVELAAYWTDGITIDVGFKPETICIARTTTGVNQTYHIMLMHIVFDTSGEAKFLISRSGGTQFLTEETWAIADVLPAIERTPSGVTITGSTNMMFSGTYRVIAT